MRPNNTVQVIFSVGDGPINTIGYTKDEVLAGDARILLLGLLDKEKEVPRLKQLIKKVCVDR